MKILRRLSFTVLILASTIAFSSPAQAGFWDWWAKLWDSTPTYECPPPPSGGEVGAPLDGGLLALLAGAGAIYVARRKKKKNAE